LLGPGWYAVARPATRAERITPPLAKLGAISGGTTTLVRSHRIATGWDDSEFLVENITTFDTAAEASRYAASAQRQSTSAPEAASHDHAAAFSRGTAAVRVLVVAGTGHTVSRQDFEALVQRARKLSGLSAHRAG
jgi:hypothetical protein